MLSQKKLYKITSKPIEKLNKYQHAVRAFLDLKAHHDEEIQHAGERLDKALKHNLPDSWIVSRERVAFTQAVGQRSKALLRQLEEAVKILGYGSFEYLYLADILTDIVATTMGSISNTARRAAQ